MQALVAEHCRIAERFVEALLEVVLSAGDGGKPAFSRLPVSRRSIAQGEREAMAPERRLDLLSGVGIGEQEFDGLEAVPGRRGKAVQECMLLVHHRQVGGEFGHAMLPQGTGYRRRMSATCASVSGRT